MFLGFLFLAAPKLRPVPRSPESKTSGTTSATRCSRRSSGGGSREVPVLRHAETNKNTWAAGVSFFDGTLFGWLQRETNRNTEATHESLLKGSGGQAGSRSMGQDAVQLHAEKLTS